MISTLRSTGLVAAAVRSKRLAVAIAVLLLAAAGSPPTWAQGKVTAPR